MLHGRLSQFPREHWQLPHENWAWTAKGAQAFVPGIAPFPGEQYNLDYAPAYESPEGLFGYPNKDALVQQDPWLPRLLMPHHRQKITPFVEGLTKSAYMAGATPSVTECMPPEPKILVALWNLSPAYTAEDVKNELAEIDLMPEKVLVAPELAGAFLLQCNEHWVANALAVVLDTTTDILEIADDKPVRALRCTGDLSKVFTEGLPAKLREAFFMEFSRDRARIVASQGA